MSPRDISRGEPTISLKELQKHNSAGDCWIAIEGKCYDVSGWTGHPGGRVIFSAAGTDATDLFSSFHTEKASTLLKNFYKGEMEAKAVEVSPFEKEFRELGKQFKAMGMMNASIPYYVYKMVSTVALLVLAFFLTFFFDNFWIKMLGAATVGFFWQQCGWLAHDFAHHQVFKNRNINSFCVLVFGNIFQGFDLTWWNMKHNQHHCIPNLNESEVDKHDGDPDINTLPFLAWSEKFVKKVLPGGSNDNAFTRFCVSNQAVLYAPLLLFARITWGLQSLSFAFQWDMPFFGYEVAKYREIAKDLARMGKVAPNPIKFPIAEPLFLVFHYIWYFYLVFAGNTLLTAIPYILLSQTLCGALLAVVFGTGHNGMKVYDYDNRPGFAELQVTASRNVNESLLINYFMGGLETQIEHHLFPMVPRHNLSKLRPFIVALCKKYNVPYHSTGLIEGNVEILKHLDQLSEALREFPAM